MTERSTQAADPTGDGLGVEVPDGDSFEQRQSAVPSDVVDEEAPLEAADGGLPDDVSPEANPADVLEQSQDVELDPEDYR